MIEVTQIRKSYGKKKVLSDITFQVKPGECVAIVKTGTTYGIALYDHIALDGTKIDENQLIK